MAKEKLSPSDEESKLEKGSRWLRNINIAVGAVALGGAGIVASPAIATGLTALAAINFAEAAADEGFRNWLKKKRIKKQGGGQN